MPLGGHLSLKPRQNIISTYAPGSEFPCVILSRYVKAFASYSAKRCYGHTDIRTYGRTDGRTDGQPENIMPPATKVGGGITNNFDMKGDIT